MVAGPTIANISQMPASTSALAGADQPRAFTISATPCQIDPYAITAIVQLKRDGWRAMALAVAVVAIAVNASVTTGTASTGIASNTTLAIILPATTSRRRTG